MVKNAFPNYEQWALAARQQVSAREEELETARAQELHGATQAAFNLVARKIERIEAKANEHARQVNNRIFQVERQLQQVVQQQLPQPNPPQMVPNRNPIAVVPPAGNALAQLRNAPRVPEIPRRMPGSVVELLLQHQMHGLAGQENAVKTHWPTRVRQAFSKRNYIYKKILLRAPNFINHGTFQDRMRAAAARMDDERAGRSVQTFIDHLKENDPARRSRRNRH